MFKKNQYLVILIILLAVIGIVSAGCLGNKNDNNTTNGTNNSTGNTSNTSDPSNNTSDTSNNTSGNTSNTSGLPDVVYANQSSGGGGGSGRSPAAASSPATLNGAPVTYDEVKDGDVVKWYFYVATSTLSNEVMTLKMPAAITGFTVNTDVLIAENGSDATNSNYSGSTANILFLNTATTDWGTSDLTITAGGIDYEISFYASAVWSASATSGGSLSVVEIAENGDLREYNPVNVAVGKSNVSFVSEPLRIKFTLQPNNGYVGLLEVRGANGTLFLTQTGLNTYETASAVTSQAYTINASFEKAVTGTYENGSTIKTEQNLNSQANGKMIYLYVPADEVKDTNLTVQMPALITSSSGFVGPVFNEAIPAGTTLTLPLTADLNSMQKAGATTPNPNVSGTVVTSAGTYKVSVLQSAVVQIVVPPGCTVTSTGGLSLTQGTHNFVADVDLADTFSASSGYTLSLTKSNAAVSPFDGNVTFASATYVLTATPTA